MDRYTVDKGPNRRSDGDRQHLVVSRLQLAYLENPRADSEIVLAIFPHAGILLNLFAAGKHFTCNKENNVSSGCYKNALLHQGAEAVKALLLKLDWH